MEKQVARSGLIAIASTCVALILIGVLMALKITSAADKVKDTATTEIRDTGTVLRQEIHSVGTKVADSINTETVQREAKSSWEAFRKKFDDVPER